MTIALPHSCSTTAHIVYRPLTVTNSHAYKILRLKALDSVDCRFFVKGSKPGHELTDAEWNEVCAEVFDQNGRGTNVAIGAFLQDEYDQILIGSALTERWGGDKTGKTAFYRSIYIHPHFRRLGIGETIELLQDSWAIKHGYTKSIFTVRADKEKWLDRQIKVFGGEIVKTEMLPYANGELALTHYLERNLLSTTAPTLPTASQRCCPIISFGNLLHAKAA